MLRRRQHTRAPLLAFIHHQYGGTSHHGQHTHIQSQTHSQTHTHVSRSSPSPPQTPPAPPAPAYRPGTARENEIIAPYNMPKTPASEYAPQRNDNSAVKRLLPSTALPSACLQPFSVLCSQFSSQLSASPFEARRPAPYAQGGDMQLRREGVQAWVDGSVRKDTHRSCTVMPLAA